MHARHTLGRLALGSFFILVPISACSSSGAPSASVDGGQDGSTAGEVSLSALSVATSSGKSLALSPSFSGDIHDYYVRCAAGTNALQVSMTASPGATSALTEPTASPAKASQRVSVSVDENAAIVATASVTV
jgi:hypothetical protein